MDTKNNFYKYIFLDIAISFMLSIFAPLEIYFSNKQEFWFSISQLLSVCFLIFTISSSIFIVTSWLINRFHFSPNFHLILFFLYIYLYIQGNYIPRNYGILNGTDIQWNQYNNYGFASIITMVICIILCIIVFWKFKNKIPTIIKMGCMFVLTVQLITIGTLVIQDTDNSNKQEIIVTSKDEFVFSNNNNIVVLILDTFDSRDFKNILDEDYQKYAKILEDFTYYPDSLGAYPTTKCALPYMLTGDWYENQEPYKDYVQRAYVNNDIYRTLKENDYAIRVYTSELYLNTELDFYDNVFQGKYEIISIPSFAKILYKLVAFNYMPHQAKRFFITDSSEFSSLKKAQSKYETYSLDYSLDMQKFASKLTKESFVYNKEQKVFSVYHLSGIHAPYTFDENLLSDSEKKYTVNDEAKGNLTLVEKFIQHFKDNGIYDNTTFIILADHGHYSYSQNPLFLIKNKDEHHAFSVSEAKMSWEYLKDMWILLADEKKFDEQQIKQYESDKGKRRFLYYRWDDSWNRTFMPGMEEYYSNGLASDPDSLIASGNSFYSYNENHAYQLGEKLYFITGRNGYPFCLYGISYGIVCEKAALEFDLSKQKFDNILLSLTTDETCGIGAFDLYANDQLIAETSYQPSSTLEFVIPHEIIDDSGKLLLEFDKTNGNIQSDSNIKPTNLKIQYMLLSDTQDQFVQNYQTNTLQCILGTEYYFNKNNNSGLYFSYSGFSNPEKKGTWLINKKSSIKLIVKEDTADLDFCIKYNTYGKQNIIVKINGTTIGEYIAQGVQSKVFLIPQELIKEDGTIIVTIEHPDAYSPKSIGNSNDNRELSLFLYSFSLQNHQ